MTDSSQFAHELPYAVPSSHAPREAAPLTRHDFATLAVRLLGLYLLIEALPVVVNLLSRAITYRRLNVTYGYELLAIATYGGAGLLLFLLAGRIGARILPAVHTPHHPPPPPGASGIQLHGAAIATCGIVLATYRGIPGLIIDVWAYYNRPGSRTTELLAQHVVETLLGIFLFFGASALANFWDGARQTS